MRPVMNLKYTLNDEVWTLHNNIPHVHFVKSISAKLYEDEMFDTIKQDTIYELKVNTQNRGEATVRLEDMKEIEIYETKDDAVKAWLKLNNIKLEDLEKDNNEKH